MQETKMRASRFNTAHALIDVAVACVTFLSASGARADTVYDVSETLGGLVLTGTITTDGTIGVLSKPNFVSYNLSLVDLSNPPAPMNPTNTHLSLDGNDVIATLTTLSFNFADTSAGDFSIDPTCGFPCGEAVWFSVGANAGSGSSAGFFELEEFFSEGFPTSETVPKLSEEVIATAPSVTPLPAAFPLFATGLGALGLFGWRRKRKPSPLAA
jgi:hypothetical protein